MIRPGLLVDAQLPLENQFPAFCTYHMFWSYVMAWRNQLVRDVLIEFTDWEWEATGKFDIYSQLMDVEWAAVYRKPRMGTQLSWSHIGRRDFHTGWVAIRTCKTIEAGFDVEHALTVQELAR